jgi:hypothetical protein
MNEYRFKIEAYTPDTMPMARLAEYMAELAILLGEKDAVHFVRLEASSTVLVHKIEDEAIPKIEQRVSLARDGQGDPAAVAAIHAINRKLKQDSGTGVLYHGEAEIIRFPGKEAAEPISFGSFTQPGSLDGMLIRLGGTGERVPVSVQSEGRVWRCEATRTLAKQLAHYLFEGQLRLFGQGRWFRDDMGVWQLERFQISHFEVLDSRPLTQVVAELREISGSEWTSVTDPWSVLERIRHGSDESH